VTDREIVRQISLGNKEAFRELFHRYGDKVYRTCCGLLNNEHDAEDITQDVFVRLYEKAGSYRGDASVSTWIYRITLNRSFNFLRRKKFLVLFTDGEEGGPDVPATETDNDTGAFCAEDRKHLRKALKSLPRRQRTAFTLFYYVKLSRKEIAEVMNTSLKSVESLLHRARENLRNKLQIHFHERASHTR